jgi:hypothetical protein
VIRGLLLNLSLICLATGPICAQDSKKPEMIDTFGQVSCDDLNARSANLANQIDRTPNDIGLVLTYAKPGQRELAIRQFRVTLARFQDLGLDDRIHFIISEKPDGPITEYWRIPQGTAESSFEGHQWAPPEPNTTKPFIFGIEDEIGICSTFVLRKFAELLTSSSSSLAHIVVKRSTMEPSYSSRGFADQRVKELTTKYLIPEKRIRVFYVRGDSPWTYAEFWFVPAKKR